EAVGGIGGAVSVEGGESEGASEGPADDELAALDSAVAESGAGAPAAAEADNDAGAGADGAIDADARADDADGAIDAGARADDAGGAIDAGAAAEPAGEADAIDSGAAAETDAASAAEVDAAAADVDAPATLELAEPQEANAPEGPAEPAPAEPVDEEAEEAAAPEQPESAIDEAPADPGSIAAAAQTEVEALGADGGDEMAAVPAGGGGGGGGAIEEQPEPPAPDVSKADPAAAVGAAASLKPAQMLTTLGGAEQAVAADVAKEHAALQAAPPAATTGGAGVAPADERYPGAPPPPRPAIKPAAARTGEPPPAAPPVPAPPPRPPVGAVPVVQGDASGNVSEGDAARLQSTIANLPVTDPGAAIPATPPPRVALSGAADPGQMAEQQAQLNQTVTQATAQGRAEAAEPAGEDDLAPTLGPERLEAPIPAAPPAAAGASAEVDDQAAGIIAEEQDGPALRAAAAGAAGQIAAEKQKHAANAAQERAAAAEGIAAEEAKGQAEQIAEKAAAKAGVSQARADWTAEQQAAADAARGEAAAAVGEARTQISAERARAETEAAQKIQAGRQEAEEAKRKGEEEARREREKAKEESSGGGILGWVKSKATALVNRVRDAVTNVFNRVRQAITNAINKARELANAVIDRAVKFVADKIKAVASAIVAIGDRLIPGFAALRQRFKTWIVNRVRQAVAALNRIVTAVKDGIRRTLQAVGRALAAGIDLLKRGMQAAITAVKAVVKAAIEKAKAVIAALGTFAVLVKDIASGPGRWLRNLGAAIMDGIRNHLWVALKTAIQQWFSDKVQQLLGLGTAVWNLLKRGGISLAQIGKMAWEGIKAAIPPALIALLIERLVAMLVPAAAAVMAIIQGLQAAWGAIQRILAAIDRFVAFLRAVKGGNAGQAFAQALAAAAVAVIEFVSQFLLRKIAGAAKKVAGKIKAIAQKIGQRLMKGARKVGGALKQRAGKLRDKIFGKRKKKKSPRQEQEDKRKRLERAVTAIRPKLQSLLQRGVSGVRLRLQLGLWRVRYRLAELSIKASGGGAIVIHARVNPSEDVIRGFMPRGAELQELIRGAVRTVLNSPEVRAAFRRQARRKQGEAIPLESGADYLAMGVEYRRTAIPGHARRRQAREAGVPLEYATDRRVYDVVPGGLPRPRGRNLPVRTHVRQPHPHSPNILVSIPGSQKPRRKKTDAPVPEIEAEVRAALAAYPQLARDMNATGVDPKDIARHMRQLVSGGQMDPALRPHARLLAGASVLIFGVESARNNMNVALAPMMLEMIEEGDLDFHEAFAYHEGSRRPYGGGVYPPSMGDSQRAAQYRDRERAGVWDPETKERGPFKPRDSGEYAGRRAAPQLVEREEEMADVWLERHESRIVTRIMGAYKTQGSEAATDASVTREHVHAHVRRYVQEYVARFYNIASKAGDGDS
ncbi:MAG TPA: hypothetical protein VFZ00_22605, partial [Solirubrobacter sp.]|nr:hypothetical protein [Solirubrobacter sp.]